MTKENPGARGGKILALEGGGGILALEGEILALEGGGNPGARGGKSWR